MVYLEGNERASVTPKQESIFEDIWRYSQQKMLQTIELWCLIPLVRYVLMELKIIEPLINPIWTSEVKRRAVLRAY